ncbi:VRR-NUC domain protein [compost metagenome]
MCLQSMKNTGFLPGVSDTVIMGDKGKVYWVEFKLPNNNQQENQIEFEQRCKDLGHEYVVIKSLEQFKDYVQTIIISK